MTHLVTFDVDGTLTASTGVDSACYAQALSEHLGVEIETNWSAYRHVTDSGIATELFERHRGTRPTPSELDRVRTRFLSLLSAALCAAPDGCAEIPGARCLMQRLRAQVGMRIAVATGAWRASAYLKLRQAGLWFDDLPIASADDAVERETIMALASKRAAEQAALASFDGVTYVGDRVWDVAAARALGYRFVGVATEEAAVRLRAAGAMTVIRDFSHVEPSLFANVAG